MNDLFMFVFFIIGVGTVSWFTSAAAFNAYMAYRDWRTIKSYEATKIRVRNSLEKEEASNAS